MVRRRLWSSFGFAGFAFATPMLAQTGAEPAPHPCDSQTGATKAVCRAGYDAVTTIVPVGALVASGGNPHLGTAGGGRGFGDLGFTFRGTVVRTILPSTAYNGTTDTVPAARRLPVVAPSLEIPPVGHERPVECGLEPGQGVGRAEEVPAWGHVANGIDRELLLIDVDLPQRMRPAA